MEEPDLKLHTVLIGYIVLCEDMGIGCNITASILSEMLDAYRAFVNIDAIIACWQQGLVGLEI